MALQSSGAISLANVQTEFGGSAPTSISEYYGAAAGVPSSGTISLSDFYGTAALVDLVTLGGWAYAGADYATAGGTLGTAGWDSDHFVLNSAGGDMTRFGINSIGPNSPFWAAGTGPTGLLRDNSPKFLHVNSSADMTQYPFFLVDARQNRGEGNEFFLGSWTLQVTWSPYGINNWYATSATVLSFSGPNGSSSYESLIEGLCNWLSAIDANNISFSTVASTT